MSNLKADSKNFKLVELIAQLRPPRPKRLAADAVEDVERMEVDAVRLQGTGSGGLLHFGELEQRVDLASSSLTYSADVSADVSA